MAQIITLDLLQVNELSLKVEYAQEQRAPLQLWVDDLDPTGIKVKVGGGIWSLPIGTVEYRP